MTPKPKFKITLPPELEVGIQKLLFEVGRVGAKAAAASVRSVASDVRKRIKEVDQRVREVEERAKARSGEDDE